MSEIDYTPVQEKIKEVCDRLSSILVQKNKQYGNSALDPIRMFSKASPKEQLFVRIDDKITRYSNMVSQGVDDTEDTLVDILGYIVLLVVHNELSGDK